MENTLYTNQQLIVDKLSYNFSKPKRGDIIIFLEDEEKGNIIDDALQNIDNFVLGDNRPVSKDNRKFGLIDTKQVEGKAIYRVYPFNEIGKLK